MCILFYDFYLVINVNYESIYDKFRFYMATNVKYEVLISIWRTYI